jgi:hypothetical protein
MEALLLAMTFRLLAIFCTMDWWLTGSSIDYDCFAYSIGAVTVLTILLISPLNDFTSLSFYYFG